MKKIKQNLFTYIILIISTLILFTMFLNIIDKWIVGTVEFNNIKGTYVAFGHVIVGSFIGSVTIKLNPFILASYFLPFILSLVILFLNKNKKKKKALNSFKFLLLLVFIAVTIAFLTINHTTNAVINIIGYEKTDTLYNLDNNIKLGFGSIVSAILSGVGALLLGYDLATK